jgi:P27 family predicted phage terminase small subunit
MTRGRKRTPLALALSRGTYRPDRHGELSDQPVSVPLATIPAAPEALGAVGRAKWSELATILQRLGLLESRFLDALEMLCRAFDDLADAEATIRKENRYTKTIDGKPKLHPANVVAQQARDEIRRYLVEFGMTPATSTRVTSSGGANRPPSVPTRKPTFNPN